MLCGRARIRREEPSAIDDNLESLGLTRATLRLIAEMSGEGDATSRARRLALERAAEHGSRPVSNSVGAILRFLCSAVNASTVVEVGTGTGVSGLWLLSGLGTSGVLTSVDASGERQRAAREAFAAAGYSPQRARLITGRALAVLPRLADRGYDLAFIDADRTEYPVLLEEAMRLLRPGGIVVFDGVVDNPSAAAERRDPLTRALRSLVERVRDDDALTAVLLPVGGGLLAASLRSAAAGA